LAFDLLFFVTQQGVVGHQGPPGPQGYGGEEVSEKKKHLSHHLTLVIINFRIEFHLFNIPESN